MVAALQESRILGYRLKDFTITDYAFCSRKIRKRLKLAVIADLHECVFGEDNEPLIRALREARPEKIVIAGDLIVGSLQGDCGKMMGLLKTLSRDFEILYCIGNHERKILQRQMYGTQRKKFLTGLRELGLGLLSNKSMVLGESNVRLTGLDISLKYYRKVFPKRMSEGYIEGRTGPCDGRYFSLLVAHNPVFFKRYCEWGADLVVSGHIHGGIVRLPGFGGMIYPYLIPFPRYDAGVYRKGHTRMVVSRGLGSHSLNLRLFNKPELIILDLIPKL